MLVTMLIIEHQRGQPAWTPAPTTPRASYAKVPPRRVSLSEDDGGEGIPSNIAVQCMAYVGGVWVWAGGA